MNEKKIYKWSNEYALKQSHKTRERVVQENRALKGCDRMPTPITDFCIKILKERKTING